MRRGIRVYPLREGGLDGYRGAPYLHDAHLACPTCGQTKNVDVSSRTVFEHETKHPPEGPGRHYDVHYLDEAVCSERGIGRVWPDAPATIDGDPWCLNESCQGSAAARRFLDTGKLEAVPHRWALEYQVGRDGRILGPGRVWQRDTPVANLEQRLVNGLQRDKTLYRRFEVRWQAAGGDVLVAFARLAGDEADLRHDDQDGDHAPSRRKPRVGRRLDEAVALSLGCKMAAMSLDHPPYGPGYAPGHVCLCRGNPHEDADDVGSWILDFSTEADAALSLLEPLQRGGHRVTVRFLRRGLVHAALDGTRALGRGATQMEALSRLALQAFMTRGGDA